MIVQETNCPGNRGKVNRSALVVPEIIVEETDASVATILKPAFDAIWNAGGWPGSIYYDSSGKWKLKT